MKLRFFYIIIALSVVNYCFSQNNNGSVNITTIWNAKSCGYKEICFPNFDTLQLSFIEETSKDTLILNFIDRIKDTVFGRDGFIIYFSDKEKNLLQKNKIYLYDFTISNYDKFYFNELILNIENVKYFFKQKELHKFKLYKITNTMNKNCNNCDIEILKNKQRKNRFYNILQRK